MKIIKTLLPIATIGSVASIIVPLTTSCGSNNAYDAFEDVDTTGWEIFDEESSISPAEALTYYADAVIKNPSIFTRDVIWGRHEYVEDLLLESQNIGNVYTIKSATYEIENANFMQFSNILMVDFSNKLHITVDIEQLNDVVGHLTYDIDFSIKQFPLTSFVVQPRITSICFLPIEGEASSVRQFYTTLPNSYYHYSATRTNVTINPETQEEIGSTTKLIQIIQDKDHITTQEFDEEDIFQLMSISWPLYYFSETTISDVQP